jgi:hypothetical protein
MKKKRIANPEDALTDWSGITDKNGNRVPYNKRLIQEIDKSTPIFDSERFENIIWIWEEPELDKSEEPELDKSEEADAERFRWLLDGNGYFMEEEYLCGHDPVSEKDKDEARKKIDNYRFGRGEWG